MSTDVKLPTDHYWASGEPLEVARNYFKLTGGPASMSIDTGSYIGINQLLAHRHYYGSLPAWGLWNMPASNVVGRSGDQGANLDIRVNWLHSNVDAKHQIICAPSLSWTCTATNTDSKSLADATKGSEILEYLWKSKGYHQQAVSSVLGAILYGEEFIFTYWNPIKGDQVSYDGERIQYTGDIEVINVPSWDVFRDTTAKSFDQTSWLGVRITVNRWDLIAQFPQYKDQLIAVDPPPTQVQGGVVGIPTTALVNSDRIAVHYFFHKRTPAMPLGLQAIFVSEDLCLEYKPLDRCYWELPVHRMHVGEVKGTAFAYSPLWETMATQDLCNDIQSALATNIVTFGRQGISVEEGTNLDIDHLGNGPYVFYRPKGAEAPVPLQLSASSPESFKHLDRLRADQRELMGLNDVALGQSPTATPNAQAWALLSSAALTANSDAQANYVKLVTNCGRSILNIFKEKADLPRKIAITGLHGPNPSLPKNEEFDKTAFTGIDDVVVEAASALSQTAAGRLQLAELFVQQGFVQTPEQLQMVVETGRLEPLTQGLRDELVFIAAENEMLLKGETPNAVIVDSHQMHIREHKKVAFNMAARMDPRIMQAMEAHIAAHMELMTNPANTTALHILGQATPPPEMPGAAPQQNPFNEPPHAGSQQTKNGVQKAMQPPVQAQPNAQNPQTEAQQPQVGQIKAPVNPTTGVAAVAPGLMGPKVK